MTDAPDRRQGNRRIAFRIFVAIVFAVFVVELGIMLVLLGGTPASVDLTFALLDSFLLIAILYPVLYFFVYLPLASEIAERRRAQEALELARADLERRVGERTEELAGANQRLLEMNERLVLTSVKAQEQAEEAQRSASEMGAIQDSIADGVLVADKEGRIVTANKAMLRMIGMSSEEEASRPEVDYLRILDLRHADGRPLDKEELSLSRALRGETVRNFEQVGCNLLTGRDINFLASAAPIRDSRGSIAGAVAVLTDITRIREVDKLKDEFISVAAHELKTPVAIMKGYAQVLLRIAKGLSGPERRMLEAVDRGSDRIVRIVKDLLDISQLHLGQLEMVTERVDLGELVKETVDQMALNTSMHSIRLVKTDLVVVLGDRERMKQVTTNLIDNAIKYSPLGDPSQGEIDVAVNVVDHEAVVSVTDSGIGIPKEKQAHIFERFYRAHTGTPYDYGGMGVGLYISKEIVARHGGRMWFKSEEGKGSTFYFSLPVA